MSERRFTRSAARAVEDQSISVKREQRNSVRQAQQRAVRQSSDSVSIIHIDVDERSREQQPAQADRAAESAVAAWPSTDDLPPLEGAEERKEDTREDDERLRAKLKEMSASHALPPPLELPTQQPHPPLLLRPLTPPQPHDEDKPIKKSEEREAADEEKEHSAQPHSVKRELTAKVEKKEAEEAQAVASLSNGVGAVERKEGDSDDEPIAMRVTRMRHSQAGAAASVAARRVRRSRRAVQYDDSSSSDSDSDFEDEDDDMNDEADGSDDDDDGADSEDDGDEGDGDEDEVISLSSGGLDPLAADEGSTAPGPPDETDLLLSSTSPATFIAPFLDFAPPTAPPLTERYCLTLALSSRSRCRRCRENIVAGYPRIGQQARLRTHLITRWYHPSCWTLTAVDDGRGSVGGRMGALITEDERDRVRRMEGRLERLGEYQAMLARLNNKETASWKKSLELLEQRKRNIEQWRESGGVRMRRSSRRTKRKVKGKAKRGRTAKRKKAAVEAADEDEEWVDEQHEERKEEVEQRPRVKSERAVKREATVKRENGVKREPRVKAEKAPSVTVEGRVKRERLDEEEKADEDEQKAEDQGNRTKRKVKRE